MCSQVICPYLYMFTYYCTALFENILNLKSGLAWWFGGQPWPGQLFVLIFERLLILCLSTYPVKP